MAKKDLGGLDWNDSLDYEYEDPFAPLAQQKKRGVITRVATSFAQGAKDAFTSPAAVREIASNLLPKGYGSAIRVAEDIHRQGEELHNIAMKELEPSLPAMRRITQRHLPKTKRYLPKGIAEKLDAFSKPRAFSGGMSEEQLRQAEVNRGMAEVFGVQMESDARQNAEAKIERSMQHAQSLKTSRHQLHTLNVMQQDMRRLVAYQDEITNRYQRRSLELQTRQYLLTRDQFRLQQDTARRYNSFFEALVKNTSMPDIEKQDLAHTARQTFRTKLLGSLQDSAQGFAGNYLSRLGKSAQSSLKGLLGGATSLVDEIDGMGDGDEGGPPMLEMLVQMLGQQAVTKGSALLSGKSQAFLSKAFPGMAAKGMTLERLARDWPLLLNKYAKTASKRDGFAGTVENFLKEVLPKHRMDTVVGRGGLAGMDKPASWDRLSQRSLVEIIPGLLSRIEHNTARVLDPNAQRQVYSHDRRGFTSIKEAGNDMLNSNGQREKRANAKQNVNRFVDEIIGDRPITDATRRAFVRQLQLDSANGDTFDPDEYINPGSDKPELNAKAKAELMNIFKSGRSGNGWDQSWMNDRSDSFAKINFGSVLPRDLLKVYRQSGMNDVLHDSGMLRTEKGVDHLNIQRLMDLIDQADYDDIKVQKKTAGDILKDSVISAGKNKFKTFMDDVTDLYKEGGRERVFEVAKLKAGHYRDATTRQVIEKWTDIKGPVLDVAENKVIEASQFAQGLFDRKGIKVSFNLRAAAAAASQAWTNNVVVPIQGAATRAKEQLRDVCDNKGRTLLVGWRLKAGYYRDQLTNKPIYSIDEIAGPVKDENGVVLTAQDIVNTLQDSEGKPLEFVLHRMRSQAETMSAQAAGPATSPMDSLLGGGGDQPNLFTQEASMAADGELIRLNSEQVELLKVIAQLLAAQGPGGGGQYPKGFLDSIALFGLKGAWGGAKNVAKGAWWWTKNSVNIFTKPIGLAARGIGATASGLSHRVGNIVRGVKDIYVQGKSKPVMTAQKLKLGHYQNVNPPKKKVLRWQDVTGPVIDVTTGETVLDQEDFEAGLYVKGLAGLTRLATKSLMGFGSSVVSFYGAAASLPFRIAGMGLKALGATGKWLFNKQVDVYVKGESSPRLQASKMKTGRYYNAGPKKTGKTVTTYEDIYGEIKELQVGSQVAQANDKTVLYENELHDPGICGRWGTALKTPFSRMLGAVGGAAVGVVKGAAALFGGALKGYGKLFGGLMGLGGGILNAPFKFLGALLNPFEKHGAQQVKLLQKIFDVLDARLPGKKYRKGSWQEQFAERDAEDKENKDEKEKAEHDKKFGIGGLLSFFKDKAKGLFGLGGGDEEDEGDGDGGDTTILAGGGGGDGKGKDGRTKEQKIKDRMAQKKAAGRRRGKLGFLFRGKDAVTGMFSRNKGKGAAGAAGAAAKTGRLGRLGGLTGGPAKIMAGLAAMAGGSWALDKMLGEDSAAREAVSTGADVGGTALGASWLSGLLGGPTISSILGIGAANAATAGTAAAAGGTAAAAGTAAAGTAAATGAGISAGAAVGTGAAAVGGTAAAVVGAPVWVPAAIIGTAVAAAGAASYFGYKKHKYGKLVPLRRFRYLQYGVPSGDSGKNEQIFALEEMMLDHIGEVNGGLEIVEKSNSGGKDITMEDILKLMDLEDGWFSNKASSRNNFKIWYARRFKPIFLTWVKAVRTAEPSMSLLDADTDLAGPKQAAVVNKAWAIDKSLYSLNVGPFEAEPAVTDVGLIEDAYNLALKEAGKTESEKKWDKWKDRAKMVGSMSPLGGWMTSAIDNKIEENKALKEGARLTTESREKASGAAFLAAAGSISNRTAGVDAALNSPLARAGKISALTSIRFRAYGLVELNIDRVRALAAVESLVGKNISVADSGNAHVTLDIEQVWMACAGLFGLVANNASDRTRWMGWYGQRFLPVFLAFVKSVRSISKSADLQNVEATLKADQLITVAQQVMNAKTPDGNPVWSWRHSPWPADAPLNADSNVIAGSMLALREAASKKVMAEEALSGQNAAVKKNKGMLDRMMDEMRSGTKDLTDWMFGDQHNRNWAGRVYDKAAKAASAMAGGYQSAWNQAKDGEYGGAFRTAAAASSIPLAAGLDALGIKGLSDGGGGTYASLPRPDQGIYAKGLSTRVQAATGLFEAVARAVGIDSKLLYAMAHAESSFHPGIKAGLNGTQRSSATGLFQFVGGTWKTMLNKYAKKWGVPENALREDPVANTLMGALFIKENMQGLAQIGRGNAMPDAYISHFLGLAGAKRFFRGLAAAPNDMVANHVDAATRRSNASIIEGRTNQQFYEWAVGKMSRAVKAVGLGGSTATQAPTDGTGPKADFSGVTARVLDGAQPPVTTTTTANGPSGGVGPVVAAAAPKAPTPDTTTNSMHTGGGYAGMMAGMASQSAPAAPSLNDTNSLATAAASEVQADVRRAQAQERDRQLREQARRATEVQSQMQASGERQQMAAVHEVLQKSLETQQRTEKNTKDTVSLLQQILRQGMTQQTAAAEAETTKSPDVPTSQRPYQQRPSPVPVSTRFASGNV